MPRPLGSSYDLPLLKLVAEKPRGRSALAKLLGCHEATAHNRVNALGELGLVRWRPSVRGASVVITDAGREALAHGRVEYLIKTRERS
jgi:DNA-binding IclR family transcriptional regulator